MIRGIYINYNPFTVESRTLIIKDGIPHSESFAKSDLPKLAQYIIDTANTIEDMDEIKVYVRAPQVFYDKLGELISGLAHKSYCKKTIVTEFVQ